MISSLGFLQKNTVNDFFRERWFLFPALNNEDLLIKIDDACSDCCLDSNEDTISSNHFAIDSSNSQMFDGFKGIEFELILKSNQSKEFWVLEEILSWAIFVE